MARKDNTTETASTDEVVDAVETAEVSEAAAAARAEIGNRPRQSVVRYVEYFRTVQEAAPERVEELFSPEQIEVLSQVADKVRNPVAEAIEKATAKQLEMAVHALQNEDALNGYANYTFSQELFDEKTKERKPRIVKSKAEKAKDLLADASNEDLEALAAMLRERGL